MPALHFHCLSWCIRSLSVFRLWSNRLLSKREDLLLPTRVAAARSSCTGRRTPTRSPSRRTWRPCRPRSSVRQHLSFPFHCRSSPCMFLCMSFSAVQYTGSNRGLCCRLPAAPAHGSIEVGFQVFEDFMSYHNGTYARTAGSPGPKGGHAVKLLGWGVDSKTSGALLSRRYLLMHETMQHQKDTQLS